MATGDAIGSPVVSGTTISPASSSGSTTSPSAGSTIAGNFQTFLTLLVQFAGIEQQLKTNDQLSSPVSLQQTSPTTQALGFVGKTAVVDGSTASLSSAQATWNLGVPADCDLTVTITSSSGETVFTGNYSATAGNNQPFAWNGKGSDGTQWPDGQYKLTTTAADSSGNPVAITTQVQGLVSSVDLSQTPPRLSIGDQSFTVNQVRRIVSYHPPDAAASQRGSP